MKNFEIDTLALLGGKKNIKQPFKKYNSIGSEEKEAAIKVIESGSFGAAFDERIFAWVDDGPAF